MSFFIRTLRDHIGIVVLQFIFFLIFLLSFAMYHLPLEAVIYPTGICILIGTIYAFHPVRKEHEKHITLQRFSEQEAEMLHNQQFPITTEAERDYHIIVDGLCEEIIRTKTETVKARQEMTDYYTTWVHQIKTPIASMRLHLKTVDSSLSRKLTSDLLHIEQYVEMVLTYVRMDADTTDYVFRSIDLDEVIREDVRKLRGDFIVKDLSLNYEPTELTVVTDEKWIAFVIEQILSNALKYTQKGSIHIFSSQPDILCITDTGIGIMPEDLPRVFEKGYTGYNGHSEKRASGIGLYLCKQICDRLGHTIEISSVPDKGTTVKITFPKARLFNK